MNWEAVGAESELMGAIGVIVSLVYLARQIQSSSASRHVLPSVRRVHRRQEPR